MIAIRPAREDDAPGIGAVHVAAWRSAYAGILPAAYLARLSAARQAAYYGAAIRAGAPVFVAAAPEIVGFTTCGRGRGGRSLGEGEIETLYVGDDWRERGIGRGLMRAAADALAARGCRSAYLWVLRDNPSRWFYARLGGKVAAEMAIRVGGATVPQVAMVWNPIETLLAASARAP
ncbi:MAG: GNAT family N-acetyltransferase [Rhodospirillales bacterium]|nr:GNAT family N-acetyltransferase [Rhodospirillales bacterium]